MQNIKNFKSALPSIEDAKKFGENVNSIKFLVSEDGQDWYECQKKFKDNTIKIMYDENGVIVSVVDKPVRERGNIYAVSMFYPINMSVAEVSKKDYPTGCNINGFWKFDGEKIYFDENKFSADKLKKNTAIFNRLLNAAASAALPLQSAVALGVATDQQKKMLEELQRYSISLAETKLTEGQINWPKRPTGVKLPI